MRVILVPISGEGSRFPREKWMFPKPMIRIDDRSIIEWTMDCLDYATDAELIFIVRREHVQEFAIDAFLIEKFGPQIKIVVAETKTDGAVSTCLLAKDYIKHDAPLFIHCSDVFFEPSVPHCWTSEHDGVIFTFKSNSPSYSYSKNGDDGLITEVAEKKVISDQASAGLYWFKRGRDFIDAAEKMIKEDRRTNGEFFICPLYQLMIEEGKKIAPMQVDKMHIFGSENEFKFFTENSLRSFPQNKKTVAVCSDHSGFKSKEIFKEVAQKMGLKVVDFGTHSDKDTDYSVFVQAACKSINDGKCDFGFGFCRSGQGVNIAANKIKGIRSVLCYNDWTTKFGVKHSCANFFAMSEKFSGENEIYLALYEVMNNTFDGGRHQTRLMKNEY